jgi:uncharacterized membrane protein
MNRNEFMTKLQNTLGNISAASKEEILYDYREHFEIGLEQGKTEEEICSGLGDPRAIAKQYRVEYMVRQADTDKSAVNVMRAIFAALSLGFINLVFMLPILGVVVGILAAFYGVAIGCVFGGVGALLSIILAPVIPQWVSLPDLNPAILVFGSISLISFGLLFTIVSVLLTRLSYKLTISYIKTNMKIITKQESERENYV